MRGLIRGLGIFFLIGGIIVAWGADYFEKNSRPRTWSYGITQDGVYKEIESRTDYMGNDKEINDNSKKLYNFGIFVIVLGAAHIIASFCIKKNKEEPEVFINNPNNRITNVPLSNYTVNYNEKLKPERFCWNCGGKLSDHVRFCEQCGNPVNE